MEYADLVAVYEALDSTSKRLEKTEILAELLRKTPAAEMERVVLLLEGRVYPAGDDRELGVAKQLMQRAIATASGMSPSKVESEWKKTGDLGEVAENFAKKKRQQTLSQQELSVKKVFDNLQKLAGMEGQGSVERKMQLLSELLISASPKEARYITRTTLQQLRIGLGAGTMRDAIALAFFEKEITDIASKKEIQEIVQEGYDLSNDFALVAAAAKKGRKGLAEIELRISIPIKVMLAIKAETVEAALEKTGKPAEAEFKFDGFRVQIHKDGDIVNVFTRRLDNVTQQFPEIVHHTREFVKAKSCILDAEAVGINPKTKKYVAFQDISQRIKRKYDIARLAKELPVEVNVFDCLSYNKKSYVKEPFKKRRAVIEKIIPSKKGKILPARRIVSSDPGEIEDFFKLAKQSGTEGLVIKNREAPYKPGARVGHMIKYKRTLENLDLVIVGAEWGEGKRSEWMSSFTVACRDGKKYVELGKVGTGIKEKEKEGLSFKELTEMLTPLVTKDKGKEVELKPKVIVEVAYEEIQKSQTYSSKYALRFPRVLRLRDDKSLSDVSSIHLVEQIYQEQR